MKKTLLFKITAIILICLTLFPMLASCKLSEDGETGSGEGEGPSETVWVDLVKDKKTEYIIVRPDKINFEMTAPLTKLRSAVMDLLADGESVKVRGDFLKKGDTLPEKAKEIVVGVTNRPETEYLASICGDKDFIIYEKNERVYIYAENDKKTIEGIEYFIANYIKDGKITVAQNYADHIKYDYRWSSITINGENIFNYKVVIPQKADQLTEFAADNFVKFVNSATGKLMTVVTDKEAESELEILIGKTNRSASDAAFKEAKDGKYVLYANGKQIVTAGEGYLVGAGAAALFTKYLGEDKEGNIKDLPTSPVGLVYEFNERATSAILMIGDGMGDNHIDATLKNGLAEFVPQQLPNKGHAITHSLNYPKVTDSAASATALGGGYKTYNKYLGLNRSKQEMQNVRELAQSLGAATAILTTDKITGATPSGFLVHVSDRNNTTEIQKQIDKVIADGKVNYCEGGLGDNFKDKIEEALYGMTDGRQNIFAMFEAALIDKRSHSNDLSGVYQMVTRYNEITSYVIEYILFHPDTALVITADHECGGVTLNKNTGKYHFTSTDHTNANVPVFALGGGTELFANKTVDNTKIAKFLADIFAPGKKFGE